MFKIHIELNSLTTNAQIGPPVPSKTPNAFMGWTVAGFKLLL